MQIARFDSYRQAMTLVNAMAGELGARYDPLTGEWRYERDGHARRLILKREGDIAWVVYLEED